MIRTLNSWSATRGPRIQDLCVPSDDDGPPATYRVVEVWPAHLDAALDLLHGRDWLTERITPVLLVHGRLSNAQAARLPPRVPWMAVPRTVDDALDLLRDALVAPLLHKGWICVDFMDYAAALGHGGELRGWRATGRTAVEASASLVQHVTADRRSAGEHAALCLHVRMPLHGTIDGFDVAASALDGLLAPEAPSATPPMCVVSVMPEPRPAFHLSLLAVASPLRPS